MVKKWFVKWKMSSKMIIKIIIKYKCELNIINIKLNWYIKYFYINNIYIL